MEVEFRRPTSWRLFKGAGTRVLAIVALIFLLAGVSHIRNDSTQPWYVPFQLSDLIGQINQFLVIETSGVTYFDLRKDPEIIAPMAALVGISIAVVVLFRRGTADSPIERIGREPRQLARVLVAWVAISGVIFTLFPVFVLLGLALTHLVLKLT